MHKVNVLSPQDCASIDDVRREIDNIDKEIIRLLAERFGYVREVVRYKDGTPQGIEADERRREVIRTRCQWAAEQGIAPGIVGDLYDRLIAYFIDEEKKIVNNQQQ